MDGTRRTLRISRHATACVYQYDDRRQILVRRNTNSNAHCSYTPLRLDSDSDDLTATATDTPTPRLHRHTPHTNAYTNADSAAEHGRGSWLPTGLATWSGPIFSRVHGKLGVGGFPDS